MSKSFFDVFQTVHTKGDLYDLFSDAQVTKIAFSSDHRWLKVYLDAPHLISKRHIYEMEKILTGEVCRGTEVSCAITEHFTLSSVYNVHALMREYRDSLIIELWHVSPIIASLFRDARLEYPETDAMTVCLEDTCIARDESENLRRILDNIFRTRFSFQTVISIVCTEPVKHRARAQLDVEQFASADEREEDSSAERNACDDALAAEAAGEADGSGSDAGDQAKSAGTSGASNAGAAGAPNPAAAGKKAAKNAPSAKPTGAGKSGAGFLRASAEAEKEKSLRSRAVRSFIRSRNKDVICGRDFDDPVIPIKDILGEMGEVCIHGQIMNSERRDIRNDKSILKFSLTDFTDSIIVKIFAPTEAADETMERLAPKKFVKVKGFTKMDTYDRQVEITSPTGIMSIPSFVNKREDHFEKKRVELHLHTKMSDMDGVSECKDLVKRAYDWGMPAVAITDHGNIQAFPDANHLVCDLFDEENKKRAAAGQPPIDRQHFFKVIYGVECYLVDDLKKIVTFGQTEKDPAFTKAPDDFFRGEREPGNYDLEKGSYVIFDIETTGFSAERDRIIEIGAVKYEHGKKTDSFSEFINPRIPIPYRITKLTSITDEDVMHAETIETILPRFLAFCEGCVTVGHNVQFDIGFIRANAKRLGLACPLTTIDTMDMARTVLPGHKSYNLDAVGKMLNVVNPHHHRAVDDAATTADIFIKLLPMFTQKGAHTLHEVNKVAEDDPDVIRRKRPYHCILLAANNTGRVNLYKMISASHLTYYYQKPKIPKSMLSRMREGILVGSACVAGELYQALLDERSDERIAEIVSFYDYLEIQPRENNSFLIASEHYENITSMEDILNINRKIVKLGEEFHKPVVATGDVHFLDPDDQIYRTIIQNALGMGAEEPAPLYFRTTDEMMEEFSYLGSDKCEEVVITNTQKIADMIEAISPVRPDKCPPVIQDSDKILREICYNKAHSMYGDPLPKIVGDRLERELTSIIKNGYSVMYIIAQKLVWKSNEDGYLVGSRGSVGSSLVAFMAGITEINALRPHYYCGSCHYSDFDSEEVMKYVGRCGVDMPDKVCPKCGKPLIKAGFDIPFETFLGFKGDKEPDIDLNFSGEYQAKAHAYTKVIFGHDQTFKAGTIATVADKTAYGYVKGYCERTQTEKRPCEMERLAAGCTGVRRSTGQHPGGIVVLPVGEDINTFTPVQHPANDMTTDIVTTHFDYHSIDHNLLKLDILGHDDPTIIRMLQDLTGIDPLTIPLDDKGVLGLFTSTAPLGITPEQDGGIKVGTLGVPEFGTKFVMGMLEDTKPTSLSELIKISGLSHGTDVWLGNAQEVIAKGYCTIATCIGCRDDIMIYLINKGLDPSESFTIMERVRKGKVAAGKVKEWPKWCEDMRAHGVPEWYMQCCEKIKYMFPKGHAAAYVCMALRIAWFKVHKPLAYYAAYYSIRAKAFDYELMAQGKDHLLEVMADFEARKADLTAAEQEAYDDCLVVREMYARGIEFVPIELGKAKARAFTIWGDKLMPSYMSIHGMGASAADALEEACKHGPFVSKDDVRQRGKLSQTIIDKMSEMGILGDLPDSNQFSLFDFGIA
ncbi:MAG: PolC-type DNA polymerase III [Lachnospiraceae bacterium]|nr:PolC-type DNA polymerase III [Lachnospiraceae bacterium]